MPFQCLGAPIALYLKPEAGFLILSVVFSGLEKMPLIRLAIFLSIVRLPKFHSRLVLEVEKYSIRTLLGGLLTLYQIGQTLSTPI
jgi:hypothetical protein